jgi:hypothetical protein
MQEGVRNIPAGASQRWQLRDTLWEDRFGAGYAVSAPGALLFSLVRELGYNRFVDICFYTGRSWKRMIERLVIDFSAVKWADPEGVSYLISQLHNDTERRPGDVYVVRPPAAARKFVEKLWGNTRIQFADHLADVLKLPTIQPSAEASSSTGANTASVGAVSGGNGSSESGGSDQDHRIVFDLLATLQTSDSHRDSGGSGARKGPNFLDLMP